MSSASSMDMSLVSLDLTIPVADFTIKTYPCLGAGAFGQVFKATHTETLIPAAAKQIKLKNSKYKQATIITLLEKELDVLRRLQAHYHIVKLFDVKQHDNAYWIFMELCDSDLEVYLRENKDLPLLSRTKIMQQTACAISFMHGQNPSIIHRDIKPANILIKREGKEAIVKVSDFGLSRLYEDRKSLSAVFGYDPQMKTYCGSEPYMAPELVFAKEDTDHKYGKAVDIFATGLLYTVVLEFGIEHCKFYAVPVGSKHTDAHIYIGKEMVDCQRNGMPLPDVVRVAARDSFHKKQIKRMIIYMTKMKPVERKHIDEVKEELTELVDQLIDEQKRKRKLNTLKEEKADLLKHVNESDKHISELREKDANKDLELTRKDVTITNLLRRNRQQESIMKELRSKITAQNQNGDERRLKNTSFSATTDNPVELQRSESEEDIMFVTTDDVELINDVEIPQPYGMGILQNQTSGLLNLIPDVSNYFGWSKDDSQATSVKEECEEHSLGELSPSLVENFGITDYIFVRDKEVRLYDVSSSLHFIKGALWSCQRDGLHIYYSDLEKKYIIPTKGIGNVFSVSEGASNVIAATSTGLYLLTFEGELERKLRDGIFTDVCYEGGRVYAVYKGKKSSVCVYDPQSWDIPKCVIDSPCRVEDSHSLRVANEKLQIACTENSCVFTMTLSGELKETQGKHGSANGEFDKPLLCQSDDTDGLMVVDRGNNRLQYFKNGKWSVLKFKVPISEPTSAVYNDGVLYLTTGASECTLMKCSPTL